MGLLCLPFLIIKKEPIMATIQNVTLNQEQKLFVINIGNGYTCRGFDNLFGELTQLASALGLPSPKAEEIGTIAQYNQHQDAIEQLRLRGGFKDTWFDANTPLAVQSVLEKARKNDTVIRIYLGDDSGRCWNEENDVIGTVGRSTGLMKVPLLVAIGEYGGMAISTNRVIKIQDVSTGKTLYQHENFTLPNMTIRNIADTALLKKGYTHEVLFDDKVQANFKNVGKAAAYIAFMSGECMKQPR
jgi:hypothetical protein